MFAQGERASLESSDARRANALFSFLRAHGICSCFLFEDDAAFSGFSPSPFFSEFGLGENSLSKGHGHLPLLENGRLGSDGLHS